MGFRVVLIENDVFIKMKLDNLVVIKEDDEIWIPIADISVLVLDNLKVTITARDRKSTRLNSSHPSSSRMPSSA